MLVTHLKIVSQESNVNVEWPESTSWAQESEYTRRARGCVVQVVVVGTLGSARF